MFLLVHGRHTTRMGYQAEEFCYLLVNLRDGNGWEMGCKKKWKECDYVSFRG